ncbi:Replication protein A 70 kDa DNA-binding subunit [Corchorus olitorius]|uniref:Replication protein A 70 kDa DNA-binding subunit n=1 Tax=Corchorus olitorius TaxID=93759 RepID=A0A1R3HH44_9ROSI|nr:Replication protein A 70 kDa DNA-binding subunit [Corchorus olitorius]
MKGRLISAALGRAGGLWLLWNEDTIRIHSASVFSRMITTEVSAFDPNTEDFLLTAMYNFPAPSQQQQESQIIFHCFLILNLFKPPKLGFLALYTSQSSENLDPRLDPHIPTLNEEHLNILNSPINESDIKDAIFCIGSFKAAGPDGFNSAFFKHFWNNIKDILSCSALIGISNRTCKEKYLGLPLIVGRVSKQTFFFLVEKAKQKLDQWYNHFLSTAGKLTLVNSVLQTLPLYAMSSFKIHKVKTINLGHLGSGKGSSLFNRTLKKEEGGQPHAAAAA